MSAPTREEQFRKLFAYVGGFQGTWVAVIEQPNPARIMYLAFKDNQ